MMTSTYMTKTVTCRKSKSSEMKIKKTVDEAMMGKRIGIQVIPGTGSIQTVFLSRDIFGKAVTVNSF